MPSETSSTASASTISPRAASPPTRLAGGTGDGPQHRPLDSAHRSGRAGGDHQDPPAAVLLPGRTDHPLGAPPHTASATALALGSPVRSCPGPIARPATPCLTAAAATSRHPANRTSPRTRASPVCECLLLHPLPAISPSPTFADGHKVFPRQLKTDTGPPLPQIVPGPSPSLAPIARSAAA